MQVLHYGKDLAKSVAVSLNPIYVCSLFSKSLSSFLYQYLDRELEIYKTVFKTGNSVAITIGICVFRL